MHIWCIYGDTPPLHPPAARGGGLLAAAAPPPGRRCPCGRCSSRAIPPRRSPVGGADRQQLPRRAGAPGILAPWRGDTSSGSSAQRCRPSQRTRRSYHPCALTAAPGVLAAPAPHPRTVRRASAARAFPLGRLLRRGHGAARTRTRSPAYAGALAAWPPAPQPHRLAAAGSAACALRAPALLRYSHSCQTVPEDAPPCTPRNAGGKLPAAAAAIVSLRCCGSSGT